MAFGTIRPQAGPAARCSRRWSAPVRHPDARRASRPDPPGWTGGCRPSGGASAGRGPGEDGSGHRPARPRCGVRRSAPRPARIAVTGSIGRSATLALAAGGLRPPAEVVGEAREGVVMGRRRHRPPARPPREGMADSRRPRSCSTPHHAHLGQDAVPGEPGASAGGEPPGEYVTTIAAAAITILQEVVGEFFS